MPRTRRTGRPLLSPTLQDCENKECSICLFKIRTGQHAIKLENERRCYHGRCISAYYRTQINNDHPKTPFRQNFSANDVDRINGYFSAMTASPNGRSRSRSRSGERYDPNRTVRNFDRMYDHMRVMRNMIQADYNNLMTEQERNQFLERFTEEDAEAIRNGMWAA